MVEGVCCLLYGCSLGFQVCCIPLRSSCKVLITIQDEMRFQVEMLSVFQQFYLCTSIVLFESS